MALRFRWPFFCAAAAFALLVLPAYGAPLGPLLLGAGLAAVWTWKRA